MGDPFSRALLKYAASDSAPPTTAPSRACAAIRIALSVLFVGARDPVLTTQPRQHLVYQQYDVTARGDRTLNDPHLAIHLRLTKWQALQLICIAILQSDVGYHGDSQTLPDASQYRADRIDLRDILGHHAHTRDFRIDKVRERHGTSKPDVRFRVEQSNRVGCAHSLRRDHP